MAKQKSAPSHPKTVGRVHDQSIRRTWDAPKAAKNFPATYPSAPGSLKDTGKKTIPDKSSKVPVDSSAGSGSIPID